MKANIHLAKSRTNRTAYYLIINEIFYLKISKKTFLELAEFLKINIEEIKDLKSVTPENKFCQTCRKKCNGACNKYKKHLKANSGKVSQKTTN